MIRGIDADHRGQTHDPPPRPRVVLARASDSENDLIVECEVTPPPPYQDVYTVTPLRWRYDTVGEPRWHAAYGGRWSTTNLPIADDDERMVENAIDACLAAEAAQ